MKLFILMILPVFAYATTGCTGKPDGSYGVGCRSYTRCTGGFPKIIDCNTVQKGYVFNKNTGACDMPKNVPPPCGIFKDCSNVKDGSYPDLDLKCTSYYTCFNKVFFGHNPCPGGTVFNSELLNCDFKSHTKPPCGTKTD